MAKQNATANCSATGIFAPSLTWALLKPGKSCAPKRRNQLMKASCLWQLSLFMATNYTTTFEQTTGGLYTFEQRSVWSALTWHQHVHGRLSKVKLKGGTRLQGVEWICNITYKHKNHDDDNDTFSCVYEIHVYIYMSICITSCFVFYKIAGSPVPSKKFLAEEKHYANPIQWMPNIFDLYLYICPKGRIGGNLVAKQHPLRMWNALDWWDHGRAEWKNVVIRDPLLWCPLLMRSLKNRLAWQWFENHLFLLDVHGRFGRGHNPRRCSTIPPCFYHFRLQIKTATKHQSRNEKMGSKVSWTRLLFSWPPKVNSESLRRGTSLSDFLYVFATPWFWL